MVADFLQQMEAGFSQQLEVLAQHCEAVFDNEYSTDYQLEADFDNACLEGYFEAGLEVDWPLEAVLEADLENVLEAHFEAVYEEAVQPVEV